MRNHLVQYCTCIVNTSSFASGLFLCLLNNTTTPQFGLQFLNITIKLLITVHYYQLLFLYLISSCNDRTVKNCQFFLYIVILCLYSCLQNDLKLLLIRGFKDFTTFAVHLFNVQRFRFMFLFINQYIYQCKNLLSLFPVVCKQSGSWNVFFLSQPRLSISGANNSVSFYWKL